MMSGVSDGASSRTNSGAAAPRRLVAWAIILGTIATIAVLQLFTTPSLMAALIAPGIGDYLSAPLSGPVIAQIYFMPSIAAIGLAVILYLLHQPIADPRRCILLWTFAAIAFVLVAVMRLDSNDITNEESKLTHFTGAILLFAAVCAAANAWLARDTTKFVLWALGSCAFAFAAFDEILELHEKIGSSLKGRFGGASEAAEQSAVPAFQDLVTLAYSIVALLVLAALYAVFRKQVKERMFFVLTFLSAAVIYFVSTMLDSFDLVLAPLSTSVDLVYLSNVLEEILEFVAASLFFVACASAFLEAGGGRVFDGIKGSVGSRLARSTITMRLARGVAYAASAVLVAFMIAVPVRFPASAALLTAKSQYSVQLFANSADNVFLHPDGMAYARGHLYVANDVPPSILTIRSGTSRILASAEELGKPETIEVSNDGTVYFTDDDRRLLLRIPPAQGPETVLGPDQLIEPKGLAFDSKGSLYVVDYGASAILVLRGNKAERYAAVPGYKPEEIAFDRFGNLYFTQESPARVMKISPTGALSIFADESSGIVAVEDIAISGDDIYLADTGRSALFKFSLDGKGKVALAFEKRTGRELEAVTIGDKGVIFLGFRKADGRLLGMRRVNFILCIADPARVKIAC